MTNSRSRGNSDRTSLLHHPSPDPPATTPQKEILASNAAIHFIPAYDESLDTTQPMSSPEHSFTQDNETHTFRPEPLTATPRGVTPSPPSKSLQQKPIGTTRRLSQPSQSNPAQDTPPVDRRKSTGTRMGRLASLFSSRAIVPSNQRTAVKSNDPPTSPSPPQSDSSPAYVGWPGTQDPRGATVSLEHSSYEGSDRDRADPPLSKRTAESAANSKRSPTEADKVHRLAAPMRSQVRGVNDIYGNEGNEGNNQTLRPLVDPWGMVTSDQCSEVSTAYSKTSSAYFPADPAARRQYEPAYSKQAAATVMRMGSQPQVPTEENMRLKEQFSPPLRPYPSNAKGFSALLDKTREVPNLMDGTESESTHSSVSGLQTRVTRKPRRAPDHEDQILEEVSSDIFDGLSRTLPKYADAESDVFDGISYAGASKAGGANNYRPQPEEQYHTLGAKPRDDQQNLQLVLLGGGLTTIQTTADAFSKRVTASDFDDNLTNSDYDQYGFARIPGFDKMASAGKHRNDRSLGGVATKMTPIAKQQQLQQQQPPMKTQEAIRKYSKSPVDPSAGSDASGSSLFSDPYRAEGFGGSANGNLQKYYVHPDQMKVIVKKFRKMSSNRSPNLCYDEIEREEDATKAFALSEMRSRIMEKDIERGLERRGGTTVVDDLVLTSYGRAALRVRDALVVAKAWRDGGMPQDVINTAMLTCRAERSYYVLRPKRNYTSGHRFAWEEVTWVDDMELNRYRCHSIGPRHLRGFEMFTIGDCQSILLKLCNEQCQELRTALNNATERQIEAEIQMRIEGDQADDGMMTEAEMIYLGSMEEVKMVSHKLVLADKAFGMVRNRIENLVAKYESLLVKFETDTDSIAPSSVLTADSSYYSEYDSAMEEQREREVLARRAERAEVRAELAAREANLSKQRVREVRKEMETEIQRLQKKLQELQSEASSAVPEKDHSMVLARAISTAGSRASANNSKLDEIKQRFRSRAAGRNGSQTPFPSNGVPPRPNALPTTGVRNPRGTETLSKQRNALLRSVGEEMYQHLDFYERSLKAVETPQS
eukprot:Nitzschia sp. Nitz4//scaffold9_size221794//108526//111748//NITZ4_001352-RA/size221794-processed-gene-0.19-mRNA-1//1//CDS//3329561019//6558//frame0